MNIKNTDGFYRAAALFPRPAAEALKRSADSFNGIINEIRLYMDSPVLFVTEKGHLFPSADGALSSIPGKQSLIAEAGMLKAVAVNAAGASFYPYEKELGDGYICPGGGIRIGMCGSQPDKTFTPDRMTSLNIRLPYDESFMLPEKIRHLARKGSLLFAGAPGSGKTTMLKACCRELCDIYSGRMKRVSVIDPRNELAAFAGTSGRYAADIVACRDRAKGIQRAVGLMSPEYIVCDEIGTVDETRSMLEGMNSGVKIIAAIHAGTPDELIRRSQFAVLFGERVFTDVVFLSSEVPGTTTAIFGEKELESEIHKHDPALSFRGIDRGERGE